ncbi:MAG: hypothetical protein HY744_32350 [Deltaproteobacteria bacterium]|nr:hypothetical protein [Deltaproteobacteria bacterium]
MKATTVLVLAAAGGLVAFGACGGGDDENGGGAGKGGQGASSTSSGTSSGSSSGGAPCNEAPAVCPPGQTCWINEAGNAFECLNAAQGEPGDKCVPYMGTPTCGENQMCIMAQGQKSGVCVQWCDPKDPKMVCPEGVQCLGVIWEAEDKTQMTGNVCEPPAATGGSGPGGAGPGGMGGAESGGGGPGGAESGGGGA